MLLLLWSQMHSWNTGRCQEAAAGLWWVFSTASVDGRLHLCVRLLRVNSRRSASHGSCAELPPMSFSASSDTALSVPPTVVPDRVSSTDAEALRSETECSSVSPQCTSCSLLPYASSPPGNPSLVDGLSPQNRVQKVP